MYFEEDPSRLYPLNYEATRRRTHILGDLSLIIYIVMLGGLR
ncbi:MAG: hypothetical protein QXK51_00990 [Candidatus Methanomethylicia archaeon]